MIEYNKVREKYRPREIKSLLIGEAPPPNKRTFFYIPKEMSLGKTIELDTSLPATIFNHYFGKRPEDIKEYEMFLLKLKEDGIYLIDIIDEPLKIRGNKENESFLVSKLPELKEKILELGITLDEKYWTFLLARNSYKKDINKIYPNAIKVRWKDFRLNVVTNFTHQ